MADRKTNLLNAYESTLSAEVGPVATTAQITSVTGLVAPLYLVLDPDDPAKREYIYCGAGGIAGNTIDLDERYLTGSAAPSGITHLSGAVVRMVPLAQAFEDLHDRVDTLNAALVTDHGALAGLADDDHTSYHTDARADTWLTTKTTTDLVEGTNEYFTDGRVEANADVIAAKGHADTVAGNPHALDAADVGAAAASHVTSGGAAHANVVAGGAAGFLTGADKTKLDGVETAATADQSAAEILTAIKTVDGSGSGLDADLLDGVEVAALMPKSGGTFTAPIQVPVGSVSAPGIAIGGSNYGWYYDNNAHRFTIAGVLKAAIGSSISRFEGELEALIGQTAGTVTIRRVDAGGGFTRFAYPTSSERYKDDIEDVDLVAAARALRPVTFRSTIPEDNGLVAIGFIAEEVSELIPLATIRDENGEVQTYSETAVLAAAVALAQDNARRLDAIEARLDG